jgi:S-adenosylmethionine hydrolase
VVLRLAEPRYWRSQVSATFHGRDVFAPAAAHLSLSLDYRLLGPPMSDWVRLAVPEPVLGGEQLHGEVIFVDAFGNLITNIPGEAFARFAARPVRISLAENELPCLRVRTYGEAAPGTLVALVSSVDTLEIAVTQGSAARRLSAGVGTPVTLSPLAG